MNYKLLCNKCGEEFECEHARYYCNKCISNGERSDAFKGIEELLKEGGYKGKDIAKKFGVSTSYVSKVKEKIGLNHQYKRLD